MGGTCHKLAAEPHLGAGFLLPGSETIGFAFSIPFTFLCLPQGATEPLPDSLPRGFSGLRSVSRNVWQR